jgi:septum site-determining protein MinC
VTSVVFVHQGRAMSDIRLNGKMVSFSRLSLQTNDPNRIRQALTHLTSSAADNQGTPVILESAIEQDLGVVIQILQETGLQLLAVTAGHLTEQALARGLTVLPADQPMQRLIPNEPVAPVATPVADLPPPPVVGAAPAPLLIHYDTIRTGQQLLSEQGDIVLTADMNSGSELIAMGNVHVYGTVRGRIIAGASGQSQSRIFCQKLEAELVSIAGTYCVADDIPQEFWGTAVQISLNDEGALMFRPLRSQG